MINNTINTKSINSTENFDAIQIEAAISNGNIPTLGVLLSRPNVTEPTPFTLEGYCENGKGRVIPCFPWNYWNNFPVSYELFMRLGGDIAKKYVETFGEDTIREAVESIKWFDFVKEEYVEEKNLSYYLLTLNGVLIDNRRKSFTIQRHKGSWTKEETVMGFKVIIRSSYHIWEKQLLSYCMVKKFPYLSQFNVAYYQWEGEDKTEFYIHTDEVKTHSLYCPFMAFKNNDFSLIAKRQTEYFTAYYKWPGGWGKDINEKQVLEWRDEHINLLYSKEAQKLKYILDLNATQGFVEVESQDYTQTLEYKKKMDEVAPNTARKIDILKERFIVYGVSNGMPIKLVNTFTEYKEALKHLTFVFCMLNRLGPRFYKDVIAEYPENFTVNEEFGSAIMHFHNDTFNVMYEIDIVNI